MVIHVVTFEASDKNTPMARVEGKISFPERWGDQRPQVGETWEVQVSGVNRSDTVNFLRLLRKIEPEKERPIMVDVWNEDDPDECESVLYDLSRHYEFYSVDFDEGALIFRTSDGDEAKVWIHQIQYQ